MKSNSKPSAEELTTEFLKTPPMVELRKQIDHIQSAADWSHVEITIKVPKALIYLLEFLEHLNARDLGRACESAPEMISRIVENDLQETLHTLAANPGGISHYRNLWNDFCDKRGAAEHKIGAEETAPEGPF